MSTIKLRVSSLYTSHNSLAYLPEKFPICFISTLFKIQFQTSEEMDSQFSKFLSQKDSWPNVPKQVRSQISINGLGIPRVHNLITAS